MYTLAFLAQMTWLSQCRTKILLFSPGYCRKLKILVTKRNLTGVILLLPYRDQARKTEIPDYQYNKAIMV